MSNYYAPTLKETPNDADIESHKLLLRGGFLRKTASGIYTFLPLGLRILQKIEDIIREEMNNIGSQEIMMPALQPSELWLESGRWNDYGPELMRLEDRHQHGFCLGPTHEELITDLIKNEINSYKQLPITLYQIQVKFRDEIRPRFGLLRSREFIMKDAYSFHSSQESLQETYDDMYDAYSKVCDRCGLKWRGVEADPGQIGGNVTTEFMALANSGEAELVHCDCGYAANVEAGECICKPAPFECDSMKKIHTPGIHTITQLSEFLGCNENQTVKALSGKTDDGEVVVVFAPGDHEVNDTKVARRIDGFTILSDEEMHDLGLHKGSMGPVNLPEGIKIYADISLKNIEKWVVGANEEGYHLIGAVPGKDFVVEDYFDLCVVKEGDKCPKCGKSLQTDRGIEVGQIFQLGTKYSNSMNATYSDENGVAKNHIMGCYGIGVTRTLAAVVEQHFDENGIIWPLSIAPAHVCIVTLGNDDKIITKAKEYASTLSEIGLEVVLDDRKERAGFKFADADLIGWPIQVIVGKKSIDKGNVEIKIRMNNKKCEICEQEFVDIFKQIYSKIELNSCDNDILEFFNF